MTACKYNTGVNCDAHDCEGCGWSPETVRRRQDVRIARRKNPQQGPTKSKRVAKVDAQGRVVQVYSSISMAAAENDVSRTVIQQRCEGKKTAYSTIDLGGFSFRYIRD